MLVRQACHATLRISYRDSDISSEIAAFIYMKKPMPDPHSPSVRAEKILYLIESLSEASAGAYLYRSKGRLCVALDHYPAAVGQRHIPAYIFLFGNYSYKFVYRIKQLIPSRYATALYFYVRIGMGIICKDGLSVLLQPAVITSPVSVSTRATTPPPYTLSTTDSPTPIRSSA